jgi:hypothetical protein
MRKGIFVLVLVLSLAVVSAHGNYGDKYYSLIYEKYDNSNRFPVEVYRLGYTYRTTDDFKKKHLDYKEVKHWRKTDYRKSVWKRDYWNKDYYYEYVPYLGMYEKVECYHRAPRDKLFYRKCP